MGMETVKNKSFKNQEVVLDGCHYDNCNFESCTFVYSATSPIGLTNNSVATDCVFKFDGAASDTLNTMRAIYSMGEWGRKHIIATFQQIAPDLKKLH